jgi:ribosomal protein L34E
MDNMEIFNSVRTVPESAKKQINGGRLNGFTDINPMWRIQCLTERFGPCGIGWKYTIEREWMERGANDEVSAFMDIMLYYKQNGEWSDGIPGTGGSSFIAKERNGLYTSDECYKMALTDAIGVAAKALGMGADVYWAAGRSKYDTIPVCALCGKSIKGIRKQDGTIISASDAARKSIEAYGRPICIDCARKEQDRANTMNEAVLEARHGNAGDRR